MAWLTRAVPIASNGFIAAISRNCGSACTAPNRGTAISPSVSTVISTLRVSSGTRVNSSRYNSAPARIACSNGPSAKLDGRYPSASTCAGSYWPTSRAGVSSAFPSTNTTAWPRSRAIERSSVDLPVPGGPSSTTCLAACSATVRTSRSRRRPMTGVMPLTGPGWCSSGSAEPGSAEPAAGESGSVMQDEAPDVLAVQHVLVTLVDLVEGVGLRDQLVQLQVTSTVELRHPRNVMERVARAKQAALHAL